MKVEIEIQDVLDKWDIGELLEELYKTCDKRADTSSAIDSYDRQCCYGYREDADKIKKMMEIWNNKTNFKTNVRSKK